MSIADYEFETEIVQINSKSSFTVQAVDLTILGRMIHRHSGAFTALFAKFQDVKGSNGEGVSVEMVTQLMTDAVQEFPDTVAELIALAAGEPDQKNKIRKFRFPVTLDALDKIFRLTIAGEHELKKLVEIVTRAADGTTSAVKMVMSQTPSNNGTGAFVSN